MSLLSSSSIGNIRCLADEEADENMLQDLQLAAALGKTLLKRNEELENTIRVNEVTIKDQAQEIEYMKKQTAALREVNDSRLKIYEQLEVSIHDLERANHRLVAENTNDKKVIKSQCLAIDNFEARCNELQKKIDELIAHRDNLLRQYSAHQQSHSVVQAQASEASDTDDCSISQDATLSSPRRVEGASIPDANVRQLASALASDEEVTELFRQLHEARSQRAREQQKVTELGQHLKSLLQENNDLEEQLTVWREKAQDVKNLQAEINALEEVRQGQLCGRCLRAIDSKVQDELTAILDHEEFDEVSMVESLISDNQQDNDSLVQDTSIKADTAHKNPFTILSEKYEALRNVQKQSAYRLKSNASTPCISLQAELEMSGEFSSFNTPLSETECQQESTKSVTTNCGRAKIDNSERKPFSATPTDFSEAETSSSGFSDETSNKTTQTDGRPGSFLISVADGEDCKFSIYDDTSSIESRFRKTPEYREIFREIFRALKRASDEKEKNEKPPLLDDASKTTNVHVPSSVPDVPSEATDDNQSIISSVVSEPVYKAYTPLLSKDAQQNQKVSRYNGANLDGEKSGKPLVTQNGPRLEYVSVTTGHRSKSSSKKNSSKKLFNDRATTPDVISTNNPKIVSPKPNNSGKRRYRPFTMIDSESNCNAKSREFVNSTRRCNTYTRSTNEQHNNSLPYENKRQISSATATLRGLINLDKSYADVLRDSNKPKQSQNHFRKS